MMFLLLALVLTVLTGAQAANPNEVLAESGAALECMGTASQGKCEVMGGQCTNLPGTCLCPGDKTFDATTRKCQAPPHPRQVPDEECDDGAQGTYYCKQKGGECQIGDEDGPCYCPEGQTFDLTSDKCQAPPNPRQVMANDGSELTCGEGPTACTNKGGECSIVGTSGNCLCPDGQTYDESSKKCQAPVASQSAAASSWAPTAPTVSLTCGATSFNLDVVFAAPKSGFTQMNDMVIAQGTASDAKCAKKSVSITTGSTQTFTGVSYGSVGSAGCGTGSTYTNDVTNIIYDSVIKVYVRQRKSNLQRTYIYEFGLECKLTRDKTITGKQTYKVTETAVEATDDSTKGKFDLDVELNFVNDAGTDQTSTFTVDNKATLKAVLKETTTNADLKFTVQSCEVSDNATPGASGAKTATLITNECNVDDSVTITPGPANQEQFEFSTRALTLADAATGASHSLHCDIYICLTAEDVNVHSDKCVQETVEQCKTQNGRKRRSVENAEEDLERTGVVSSKQTFVIDAFDSVRCPAQAVFDTIEKRCTLERVIKVIGVSMDKEWKPEYGNASSTAFKGFAATTERYIQSLILANGKENVIRGVRVISARSGSVVVDVHLTYADHVSPQMAFQVFKGVLYNTPPQVTRIVNLLEIIQEKTIEFVPFGFGGYNTGGSTIDQNILIIIGLVVGGIASICAVVLYHIVKRGRRRPVVESVGIDNIVVEKE